MEENKNNELNNKAVDTAKQEKFKPDFVPAYQKKNIEDNTGNKKGKKAKKEKVKNGNRKKIFKSRITLIIIVAVILVLAFLGYMLIRNNSGELSNYDKLMEEYGFSTLYNNEKVNPKGKVTKSEAIKLILACFLNTEDIRHEMFEFKTEEELEYSNENYIDFATNCRLLSEGNITKSNENENIKYIDAICYVVNAKKVILGKNIDVDAEVKFKDYEIYNNEQKNAISDLVYNDIIENKKTNLNGNKYITKSQFNELLINSVLKYNLITLNDDKINIKADKMPSNKNDYPYTLANVDKTVYEKEYFVNGDLKKPIEIYASLKSNYERINNVVTKYIDTIINVDCNNFNEETFRRNLYEASNYNISVEEINEYVAYIKSNNIVIEGTSKVQFPIIYFDGKNYRARVKVDYNIKTADKLSNLIFGDTNNQIYSLGQNSIYVDIPFDIQEEYGVVYVLKTSINNCISGKVSM